jgi:excisionase family DNA binding protein
MVDLAIKEKSRWLSMGEASRILEVNDATLRQWADNGHLRVYRTPGGHRRFLREDVAALTEGAGDVNQGGATGTLEGSALRRIRRGLHQETVSKQSWYQSIEEGGRDRMRLFGRRLLSLLVQENPGGRRRQQAVNESLMLGREYGTEMAARSVSLRDTVEAFAFFRNMVLNTADHGAWTRILELADQVLLGVVESYQKRPS